MSASSPADLAVAFRSIPRRVEQALESVGGDRSVGAAELSRLDRLVSEAASVLGTPAEASAVATELTERPADAWDESDLDRVRALALEIGAAVRAVESAAERAAG